MPKKQRSPEDLRVEQYCHDRLTSEIEGLPRGAQSDLARRLKISTAHVSNVLSKDRFRGIGTEVRRKLAKHWGMTLAELEEAAAGKPAPFQGRDPPIGTLFKYLKEVPGLGTAVDSHPEWKTSTVARLAMTKFDSPDGTPRGGWERAAEAIESGAADIHAGGLKEAVAAVRRQRGRRSAFEPRKSS